MKFQSHWMETMKPKNKILLVDDDQDFLESMKISLDRWYDTISASSVDEAQKYLQSNLVEVVITDLKFKNQNKDGLDLIDWVTNEKSNIPVIILSGDDNIQRIISGQK